MRGLLLYSLALLAIAPSPAKATPVFLKCTLSSANEETLIHVQLNEQGGTSSYTFPKFGRSLTVPAIFTPDEVVFNGFFIDRATLAFKRKNSGLVAEATHMPPYDHGSCQIDSVKRAF